MLRVKCLKLAISSHIRKKQYKLSSYIMHATVQNILRDHINVVTICEAHIYVWTINELCPERDV